MAWIVSFTPEKISGILLAAKKRECYIDYILAYIKIFNRNGFKVQYISYTNIYARKCTLFFVIYSIIVYICESAP